MESKHETIIYWSNEDEAFLAEAPELAGCMADGKSHTEAVQNIEIVIRQWIDTAVELAEDFQNQN